ncbi:MAG: enoyl-CoA hydratase/isomerase family protein [Brevibacterium sp.]|uniref:enoyl-CoA hydratase/isomerase family protein n=1 Tax=Brevibacterium sp. TaxID=1701 RepID=UPI0026479982|nr:enoyl-CoA hydratase/isomerase family protein [Brevibacterium sp.]MDN5807587.1 enoyl-CoA hydratase/isomerase family protein [Brevibacterium sp.]MDN5833187.1 enoyl-CoA hydratase/isomerase family protein [Brevibacterium sp.]MDN5875701.1 enoyl-CoA hydratase/isomerase family protein [Brevibacterium sp.]MDN5909543.1 enoyl-CoA hydratase/isomerase family protein [Brevibacterium sp.]MDN6124259.1 enoyl-CoA hydratase/isomerase family protein [Brevibacterium sp.]
MTEIRLSNRGNIAEIVLDGPDSRNALDADNLRDLAAAVSKVAEAVPSVRALLIRGEGKVFSSGRDISAVDVETDDAHAFLAEAFTPVFQAIRALPIPVISQVQGAALGLGFGVAAAADIIIAADNAKFGSPFAAIGAMLDSGAHHVFLDRVGYHRTMDLIITGDFMTGAEAAAAGIVSRVVPVEELAEFVESKLSTIVTGPAEAFAMEKGFVQKLADERPPLAQVLAEEANLQESARQTPDYAEGFKAFQERRAPKFT